MAKREWPPFIDVIEFLRMLLTKRTLILQIRKTTEKGAQQTVRLLVSSANRMVVLTVEQPCESIYANDSYNERA